MAALMAITAALGPAGMLMAGGTVLGAAGKLQEGNAAKAASRFEAAQLDAQANTERASGQRAAIEETRNAQLVQSRARAVGAASGGGVDAKLAGDLAQEGQYRSLLAMWQGDEAAIGREQQASAVRFDGEQAQKAGRIGAASTLLSGGSSLYERFA